MAGATGMSPAQGALPQLRAATDPGAKGGELYAPRVGHQRPAGAAADPAARRPGLGHRHPVGDLRARDRHRARRAGGAGRGPARDARRPVDARPSTPTSRAAVARALRTLVARNGFHGASMSAVAAEAGRRHRHRVRALRVEGRARLRDLPRGQARARRGRGGRRRSRRRRPTSASTSSGSASTATCAPIPTGPGSCCRSTARPFARAAHEMAMAADGDPIMAAAAAPDLADAARRPAARGALRPRPGPRRPPRRQRRRARRRRPRPPRRRLLARHHPSELTRPTAASPRATLTAGHDGGVALYVDRLIDYTGRVPYRHKVWCHLVADTDDELLAAAAELGASGRVDAGHAGMGHALRRAGAVAGAGAWTSARSRSTSASWRCARARGVPRWPCGAVGRRRAGRLADRGAAPGGADGWRVDGAPDGVDVTLADRPPAAGRSHRRRPHRRRRPHWSGPVHERRRHANRSCGRQGRGRCRVVEPSAVDLTDPAASSCHRRAAWWPEGEVGNAECV